MAHNTGLSFTFNPNYKPQEPITPPIIYRSVRTTLQSSPTNAVLIPRAEIENPRISIFNRTSRQAFQSSEEIGKKVVAIRYFITDLMNPNIDNSIFVQSFRQHVGAQIFRQVCCDLSLTMTGVANAEAGERLLNQNFRTLLRLKNAEGRNPVEQVLEHFRAELETYRAIGEVNNLAATLISYQDTLGRLQTAPILPYSHLFINSSALKAKAEAEFRELSAKAMGMLCMRIWELDGKPPGFSYGKDAVLLDIKKLLNHRGTCPIDESLAKLESEKEPAFNFAASHTLAEAILPFDTSASIQDIQKIYQLEELKLLMADRTKDNELLVSKFKKMQPELREMLNKLIWLACYKPQELGFGERFLMENMRILLNVQNSRRENIIEQLISHYSEKVKAQRLEKEIESFIIDAGKIPHQSHSVLQRFNALSDKAKEDLRYKVWYVNGGRTNPYFGGFNYGGRTIDSDPYCLFRDPSIVWSYWTELKQQWEQGDQVLFADLDRAKTIPDQPIDVSSRPLEQELGLIGNLPKNLRAAFITAELAGVASLGGLGSALDGMIRGFGADDARVIMPLYRNGPISNDLIATMKETEHEITVDGRKARIMKTRINGVRCYFVDMPEFFVIPKKADGTSGNFYEGEYHLVKRRWAVFEKAAAELSYKFSKKEHPVELIHVHDAQTALVPKFIENSHPEEWARGETPATVFTFHNNREPNVYEDEQSLSLLERMGLPKKRTNSFIEGLGADMVTTVSETFGKEAQLQNPDFGNGMDRSVHQIAAEGKLVGIVNGNSNGFNPAKDEQLRTWVSCLPATKGTQPGLRFGPDMGVQELAEKTKTIQQELCAYLKQLSPLDPAYADLDPEKPIVMYLGRYDTMQKGINKLPLIMEETIKNGGQFVCIGIAPDPEARDILEAMKKRAKELGNKGVLILEDHKINNKFVYQGVFGNLLRAACALPIFPSRYEPCGLVQGEFNRFGKKVIATSTGGFPDTLTSTGPNANGYLFDRKPVWNSTEQDLEMIKTLQTALVEAKTMQKDLYHGTFSEIAPHIEQMRKIMRNALASTWESTPDGSLSAIRRLELVYAKAFQQRKMRGIKLANLRTVKV